MEKNDLALLLQWKKKQFLKLNEVLSATGQLAGSIDRNDQVSVNLWVSMREEPIQQAQELQARIGDYILKLPREDAVRANELLTGAAAEREEERALCEQVSKNQRLLERVLELDRMVSSRFGGKHSFYQMYR